MASQAEIDTAKSIGKMEANIATILERQDRMEKKLDGVVAMTNRWKGGTAIVIFMGAILGYALNFFIKMTGKA